jgi:hypothetical protein
VATPSGYFQCPPGTLLPDNVTQIRVTLKSNSDSGLRDCDFFTAVEVRAECENVWCGNHPAARDDGGGWGACGGNDQLATLAARRDGGGNHARDGPQATIESQLCEKFMLCKIVLWYLPRGTEDTQCDREVKAPALLGQIGWSQVYGDTAIRESEVGVEDGAADAILAFSHGGLWEANDIKGWQPVG